MSSTQMLYAWATRCALPLASLYLTYRARKQPDYSKHWDERFGWRHYPAPEVGHPRLWLHAVSLGETVATRPLIEAFLTAHPDAQILLTCMTPTGREAGGKIVQKFPGKIVQCYLPYDTPELMGKFLDETRPKMGLIMETEVWPNLLREAQKRSIPMILANARESEKSAKIAERFISIMKPAFSTFKVVLAQSQDDAARLKHLGARNVCVCGSMKFDLKADQQQVAKAKEIRAKLNRPVILLASTRDTEEAMFVESIKNYGDKALILIVPRHPQRFNDVADLLKENDISFVRKSQDEQLACLMNGIKVLLGDTMGEMSFYCAMADVCLMGGSFGGFGSQNLIEPAASGAPVILGPSTFNFAKPADDAVVMGAAEKVDSAQEGFTKACEWLIDGKLADRSQRAKTFAQSYTGATQKQMAVIEEIWREASQ